MLIRRATWVIGVGFFTLLAPGCGQSDEPGGGSGGADGAPSGGSTSTGGGVASGGASSGGSPTATGGGGSGSGGGGDSAGGGDGGDDQGSGGDDGQPSGGMSGSGGGASSGAYVVCDQDAGEEDNPDCGSGMICRVGYCTPACENNIIDDIAGTGEDCPVPATGEPRISCGLGYCYLRCFDGGTCPDQLVCNPGPTPGTETCSSPAEAPPQ